MVEVSYHPSSHPSVSDLIILQILAWGKDIARIRQCSKEEKFFIHNFPFYMPFASFITKPDDALAGCCCKMIQCQLSGWQKVSLLHYPFFFLFLKRKTEIIKFEKNVIFPLIVMEMMERSLPFSQWCWCYLCTEWILPPILLFGILCTYSYMLMLLYSVLKTQPRNEVSQVQKIIIKIPWW